MILEACVETREEAILAERLGASRLELCANLSEGGITPELPLLKKILQEVSIPVKVMIRPQGGDFIYSEADTRLMLNSIRRFREYPISGFVFGALTRNRELDLKLIKKLVEAAAPLDVTIHRAIDLTPDPSESAYYLSSVKGVTAILTSGGAETALEGADMIRSMIPNAGKKINVIAAGKITNSNLAAVRAATGVNEFHGRRIVGELTW